MRKHLLWHVTYASVHCVKYEKIHLMSGRLSSFKRKNSFPVVVVSLWIAGFTFQIFSIFTLLKTLRTIGVLYGRLQMMACEEQKPFFFRLHKL